MHPNRRRWGATAPVAPFLLTSAALAGSGCTLLGLAIGSAADSDRAKVRPRPAWRVASIPSGTPVVLKLVDGRRVAGESQGIRFRGPAEYVPLYEAARADGIDLPELGPCTLVDVTSATQTVELLGLDPLAIVVRTPGGQTGFEFDRIAALRDAGERAWSGPSLKRLTERRDVPLLSMVLLRGIGEPVPLESIVRVDAPLPPSHQGKLVGAVAGLVVDGLLIRLRHPRGVEDPILCQQGSQGPCGVGR